MTNRLCFAIKQSALFWGWVIIGFMLPLTVVVTVLLSLDDFFPLKFVVGAVPDTLGAFLMLGTAVLYLWWIFKTHELAVALGSGFYYRPFEKEQSAENRACEKAIHFVLVGGIVEAALFSSAYVCLAGRLENAGGFFGWAVGITGIAYPVDLFVALYLFAPKEPDVGSK